MGRERAFALGLGGAGSPRSFAGPVLRLAVSGAERVAEGLRMTRGVAGSHVPMRALLAMGVKQNEAQLIPEGCVGTICQHH
jgi:hypothetical protein